MFDLKGMVAIVTGGNGGIGLGMARGLATAGARVIVAARNAEKSRAAVDELARLGAAEPLAIEVDVADESSVVSLVGQAAERCGRIDVLVNNAGIQTPRSILPRRSSRPRAPSKVSASRLRYFLSTCRDSLRYLIGWIRRKSTDS